MLHQNPPKYSFNHQKIIIIALAYVGVITGAGLSSGQEIFQYFASFGKMGMIGVVILGVLHAIFGGIILALGSFYRANEHSQVLDNIAGPWVTKLLDWSLIVSGFTLGFVMIAGAGANLNQEFGAPTWLGAALCSLLVIGISMLNFEKVTAVIGIFTPIVVFIIFALTLYTFVGKSYDWDYLDRIALSEPQIFPNAWLSLINYYALCIMAGASMAFVLGGKTMYVGEAARGGFLGGALIGLISACTAFTIFANIDLILDADLPMQLLVANVHPWLGTLMSFIIFAMIFNTAISLYYSLAKRFSGDDNQRFKWILIGLVLVGFILSFAGFKKLVSIMFPIIGYIGMLLLVVLLLAWIKNHKKIKTERINRRHIYALMQKKLDDSQSFNKTDEKQLNKLIENSVINDQEIKQDMTQLVKDNLDKS